MKFKIITLVIITTTILLLTPISLIKHFIKIEFISAAELYPNLTYLHTKVGGLSGLSRDPISGNFYAISDDKGEFGPSRIYSFNSKDIVGKTGIIFPKLNMISLTDKFNQLLPAGTTDLESLCFFPDGKHIAITSEKNSIAKTESLVGVISRTGTLLYTYKLPSAYKNNLNLTKGMFDNLGFEGIAVTGTTINLLLESSLIQDDIPASTHAGTNTRFMRIISKNQFEEYLYHTDKLPKNFTEFSSGGNSELLAINNTDFLVLERSYDPILKKKWN